MKNQMKTKGELKEIYENLKVNALKTCLKCGSKASEVTIRANK